MKTWSKIYPGNLTLDAEDACVTGIISGDLHIPRSSTVRLTGIVSGNVHVQPAATLLLDGMVQGNVFNDGGFVHLKGLVGGSVHHRQRVSA